MSVVQIILIALALAMDSFAVSIACGIAIKHSKIKHALIMAAWFGGFQALMPFLGWFLGLRLRSFTANLDHWIAFALMAFLGGKMVYESFKIESQERKTNPFASHMLLILSIATSIDALAAGISFAVLKMDIIAPIMIIGVITFAITFAGVLIGERGGHFFEKKIELAGGLVLIAIGLKILFQHFFEGQ